MAMDELGREISRSLYAKAIGGLMVEYIDRLKPDTLHPLVESEAVDAICKIKAILDEDDAADPECFHRIDAIVGVLEEKNIYTSRHEW